MNGIRGALRAFWDGTGGGTVGVMLAVVTTPLSWAFGLGVALRAARYHRRVPPPTPIPVISVGNLSVGGTGKTPLAAWVIALLERAGRRPCLVARGYGQDELDLHRRWNPAAGLEAAPDRRAGVDRAAATGHDLTVLDDAFQHRRVHRDLDLVLVSAEEGLPGRLLPRGPFREPRSALSRAHGVIITRKSASAQVAQELARTIRSDFPHLAVARVRFLPGGWQSLSGAPASAPAAGNRVVAACSIAHPETFLDLVTSAVGSEPPLLVFPDHHDYGPVDLRTLATRSEGGTLVVTEKDAVKLATRLDSSVDVRVLPLETVFEEGEGELESLILETVLGNKAGEE